jgi:hypothetical protein
MLEGVQGTKVQGTEVQDKVQRYKVLYRVTRCKRYKVQKYKVQRSKRYKVQRAQKVQTNPLVRAECGVWLSTYPPATPLPPLGLGRQLKYGGTEYFRTVK